MKTTTKILITLSICCLLFSGSGQNIIVESGSLGYSKPDNGIRSKTGNEERGDPVLRIHYLGHSGFVMQFDNGVSVVADYGHYNAWYPGWDSPIHDIGDFIPTIMTYSHAHADHYDLDRIPVGVEYILTELDSLNIDGLNITPIRVCENNINVEDNSAYLFTYKAMKFLHLGDAQAQIMSIENEEVADHIKEIIPDSLDMLFMTIQGQQQFIEEAELFVDLLKPKRIIPMHYWSMEYKLDFLDYLITQNSQGKHYEIVDSLASKFEIYEDDTPSPVEVISLSRSPFSDFTGLRENSLVNSPFTLNQNSPNPFRTTTKIYYVIHKEIPVKLVVHNILGVPVVTLVDKKQALGKYEIEFDSNGLESGYYYFRISSGQFNQTKKLIINQ